ncbi:3-hydroxyisobutyrate dehydrogenase [Chitinophaga costaii]|uniref:3-hydroxyisobutyrate dehydrogenase n=1 Tax=Chitinophaga costaii TaxID=1335309 RepID=A0A1C4ANT1_9BACT|nr:NAD(P)-dependent oxidoreductase [Chitinophaga costaii]PUZ26682.1 NAD(P)-dependent oxidoreductase [Chitinophaga costaii]SCB96221.1 3-hydroxyisobutyrate dehydrogenase [Chitinophaga costaii]
MKIGFIGLGAMGQAIAGNILKAGFSLTVYNRTVEKTTALQKAGAAVATTVAELCKNADIVLTMITDDSVLAQVSDGADGLLQHLKKNALHISLSTISPDYSDALAAKHAALGQQYIAAPVFGKPDVAAAAKLWIANAGSAPAKEKAKPILQVIGQGIYDFGEHPGAANLVKLSGNFIIAAMIETLAEAYTLGEKNGITRNDMHAFFSSTLFPVPIFKNYGRLVADHNYLPIGGSPKILQKDMRLVNEVAANSSVPMPFANIVHNRMIKMANQDVEEDWAGFARQIATDAGL